MICHTNRVTSHDEQHCCVLAQELLGDCAKSCLERRRAARLRQKPPNSPKRQLPAQTCPMLRRAKTLLSLIQISPSSGFSKAREMCNSQIRKWFEMQLIKVQKIWISDILRPPWCTAAWRCLHPQPKCCRWAHLHTVWDHLESGLDNFATSGLGHHLAPKQLFLCLCSKCLKLRKSNL